MEEAHRDKRVLYGVQRRSSTLHRVVGRVVGRAVHRTGGRAVARSVDLSFAPSTELGLLASSWLLARTMKTITMAAVTKANMLWFDALLPIPGDKKTAISVEKKNNTASTLPARGAMYSASFRVHNQSMIQSLMKRKAHLFAVLDSHLSDTGTCCFDLTKLRSLAHRRGRACGSTNIVPLPECRASP